MASNVQITPGTGDVVAAEDIGSVKYQKVKLIDATAGATGGTGILGNPLVVSGSTVIVGSATVTGSVVVISHPAVTGTVLTIQPVAANNNCVVSNGTISVYQAAAAQLNCVVSNGSIAVNSIPAITGSVAIISQPAITGSVAVVSHPAITGSVAVVNTLGVHPVTIPTASTALIGTVIVSNGTNVAVTGSVVVISHPAITGSVSVVNATITVTGSTAVVGSVTVTGSVVNLASTNSIGQVMPSKYPTTDDAEYMNKYFTNAGAVTDGIIWSPAAGKRWYVTDLFVNVSTSCTITIEDDKAGGDNPVLKAELGEKGGFCKRFVTPLASGEDGADLIITTTAGNVYVTANGYEV